MKLICSPTSSPEPIASPAARSESSIKTIALAELIRFAARHAIVRSVATTQRPKSSAFTLSMSLEKSWIGLEDYCVTIRAELSVQQGAVE